MRTAYSVAAVRAAEDALMARLPAGALMTRAATGLATVCAAILPRVYGARVLLLVGAGNNGGDALYAGAALARRGARVEALLTADRAHEGGLAALRGAGGRVLTAGGDGPTPSHSAPAPHLVVDGILGIGGRGALRGAALAAVSAVPAGCIVVAVDVPSGVDADTGVVPGPAVRAELTVTFGALKPGLLVDPGAAHAGVVEVVDIGLDPYLGASEVEALQTHDVDRLLPRPTRDADKYRRGVLGVAAGSEEYTGAAVLCVGGAVRSGAGMVRYAGDDAPTALVRARWPEVVVGTGRVQAWAVGSGGGRRVADRLETAFADGVPMVVDADALGALGAVEERREQAGARGPRPPLLLTPHAGELAKLLDADRAEVEARRLEHALAAARTLDAVVLLKGSTTIVATPAGRVRVNPTGTPELATAGSGDVLAGLCGTLLAAGLDPLDAGSVGAYLHGLAGRLASDRAPLVASDLLEALPRAVRAVRTALED